MRAMILPKIVSLAEGDCPLQWIEVAKPVPGPKQLLLQVLTCGVCHTELDEIEGRTPPLRFPIIPGHQVVGRIVELGSNVTGFEVGDRVGVGWIHSSSGMPDENLSPDFRATGRDVDGGYAEFMVIGQDYAYSIPSQFSDEQAAPLLCAGAVGYRALRTTDLRDGQRLGLTGFGGSAHLVLQTVRYLFPNSPIYVFARDPSARQLATQLGAVWVGNTSQRPPDLLDAIIDTTPAWKPIVEALACLAPGGRLVINAIRKEAGDLSELLRIRYEEHLWMERQIRTVANVTQFDIREFLPIAAAAGIIPAVEVYRLEEANRAIIELKRAPIRGAKVLKISP
jgi:alcohol dehydrogenase, propanol-preferring